MNNVHVLACYIQSSGECMCPVIGGEVLTISDYSYCVYTKLPSQVIKNYVASFTGSQ